MNTAYITKAEILLNTEICKQNIRHMAEKAAAANSIFRPHFKTHQSAVVGEWFKDAGVTAITVSSLSMAEYFAENGWNDLTIAIPFNIRESEKLNALAENNTINIIADDPAVIKAVDRRMSNTAGLFLKVDCGYNRTGVDVDNGMAVSKVLDAVKGCRNLIFKGFLTHSGHTYHAGSTEEIQKIHQTTVAKMKRLKQRWNSEFPDAIISIGDTPSMSVVDDFKGIDEVRPGNFVFYDLMQNELGACNENQIAVAVAAPVIGRYPERKSIVVHCGGVHLSKEALNINGTTVYGQVVLLNENGWKFPEKDLFVTSLSQEHGTITVPAGMMKQFKPGFLVGIIPVHSCLTADCFSYYLTTDGEKITRI